MDNETLLRLARTGSKEARDAVVKSNSALVWSVVKRFCGRGYDKEDIFQIGCIGMLKAIDRFDTKFGVKFSTYAVPLIMGEIRRFMRDDGLVKVSRSLKELGIRAAVVRDKIICERGAEPTVSELAAELGADRDTLVMALEASQPCDCLDRKLAPDSDAYLIDTVTYDLDTGEAMIDSLSLRMAMDELDDEDRELVIMRFFRGKTQREVAERMHISQVQISRREKKILRILREKLSA